MKLSDVDTKEVLSDNNLARGFITSALFGAGTALLVPALIPVALTGMAATQAIYWGKELSKSKDA